MDVWNVYKEKWQVGLGKYQRLFRGKKQMNECMKESELIHDLIKIFEFLLKWTKAKVPYYKIFCLGGEALVWQNQIKPFPWCSSCKMPSIDTGAFVTKVVLTQDTGQPLFTEEIKVAIIRYTHFHS